MNRLYNPIEKPFIIFHNKNFEKKSSPQTPYHRHNAYEFYLFLNGNRRMCIEDTCFICQPGDLLLIPPEKLHAGLCDEDCEYERLIINVKPEFLETLSKYGTDLSEAFRFTGVQHIKRIHLEYKESKTLLSLYEAIQRSDKHVEFAQPLLTETYILQLFIFLNRWFLRTGQQNHSDNIMPEIIRNVMTYIQANLSSKLTAEHIAGTFYFQSRYLSKMFKEYTGLTLKTYILDQRIALAKKLLCEGYNVSEVCDKVGFNDYANFLRTFKNYAGTSPGKYARMERSSYKRS